MNLLDAEDSAASGEKSTLKKRKIARTNTKKNSLAQGFENSFVQRSGKVDGIQHRDGAM
jgi:hypothetical protein